MLEIVKWFKIPFLKDPTQETDPQTPQLGQEEAAVIQVDIGNMLKKGAIQQTEHQAEEFLSNIVLVWKRDGGNQFIPYLHFKMQGLICLHKVLQQGDYMCKLDMKDTYFSVPLRPMFGFHGQKIFTSSSAYVSAWDQLQESSQNC